MVIHLKGQITEQGKLKLDLPSGLPAGEAQVTIEIPTEVSAEGMPSTRTRRVTGTTLTEERKVAWRVQGTGPDPAHSLVIFRKVEQGKVLHKILSPGQVFKRPLFTPADFFEAYAISADGNLRHEFSRKYQARAQTWTFTLHFNLQFRVGNAERLGLSLSGQDPLEQLQEEVANVLSATARGFSWAEMKQEGEDFGFRLREAETADGQGEFKTNFRRLQDFAAGLGLDLRHLDVYRSLTEPDLADELKIRENNQKALIARSDHGLAAEQEELNHGLQLLKDQHRIERETALAKSSKSLERLRSILNAITQEGIQGIHQSVGGFHSFDAMNDVLFEIQGIQASLVALSDREVQPFAPDHSIEKTGEHEMRNSLLPEPKRLGATAMLGFAKRFRPTRRTADWMVELREGEEP